MKEKLLFVTKGGEGCDEGFSYVLELAKVLKTGIAVLMVYGRHVMQKYEDVMASVAFAEAGDLKTVEELMNSQRKEIKKKEEGKIREMAERCADIPLDFTIRDEGDDVISTVGDFLKGRPGIDMVLLSPNLSGNKKMFDTKKMLKSITKPIVTITKSANAEAEI